MGALTNVATSPTFAAPYPARTPLRIATVVASNADAVRPTRIGGAPLAGARAVDAYRRTAVVDASSVLSRIDERA